MIRLWRRAFQPHLPPRIDSLWHGCGEEKWVFILAFSHTSTITYLLPRVCKCLQKQVVLQLFQAVEHLYSDWGEKKMSCVNEFKGEVKEELCGPGSQTHHPYSLHYAIMQSSAQPQDRKGYFCLKLAFSLVSDSTRLTFLTIRPPRKLVDGIDYRVLQLSCF